jgi:hypothetical protein
LVNLRRSIQAKITSPRRRRLTRMLRTRPEREITEIGRKTPRKALTGIRTKLCELLPKSFSVD